MHSLLRENLAINNKIDNVDMLHPSSSTFQYMPVYVIINMDKYERHNVE